jgi:hypothetical protein
LVQRKTQTPAYWQGQFTVSNKDIEFIYNLILEENRIFYLEEIIIALVRRQCQAEEIASRSELQQGKLYQPKEKYSVGEKVVFPALDFAVVHNTPGGYHPIWYAYVIGVADNGGSAREFSPV